MIQVDISNIWGELSLPELLEIEKEVAEAHARVMEAGTCRGWPDMTGQDADADLGRIMDAAEKIRSDSDVCLVVGLGGSCLGARAVVELLQGRDRNLTKKPQILFAGDTLSTRRWQELQALLDGRDFSIIVLPGSGEALEPAIAFRGLRWMLERKYGTDEASSRIYAVL